MVLNNTMRCLLGKEWTTMMVANSHAQVRWMLYGIIYEWPTGFVL